MADISVTEKKGGNMTWVWAIIAIALIAALMIWLSMQEGTTSPVPIVEEDTTEAVVGDTLPADTAATGAAAGDTASAVAP